MFHIYKKIPFSRQGKTIPFSRPKRKVNVKKGKLFSLADHAKNAQITKFQIKVKIRVINLYVIHLTLLITLP